MTRRDAITIAVLSLIWGASFMFIKVGVRSFDPAALVWLRLTLACVVMVPAAFVMAGRRAIAASRPLWWRLALLGIVNTTIPYLLITWAETRIDSGLAAILQAAAPIFSAAITTRLGHDSVAGVRLAGVLLGFVGVGLLVGSPGHGGIVAALAVVLAALCYALAASLGAHLTHGTPPVVVAAVSTAAAALVAAPAGIATLPASVPGWKEVGSILALGIVGTGIAYILVFELLRSAGASRTILVTYLIPPVALFYGVVLLGESLRWVAIGGLVLVLAGVALASRRRPVGLDDAQVPAHDVPHHGPDPEPGVL